MTFSSSRAPSGDDSLLEMVVEAESAAEAAVAELRRRWEQGERPRVEDLLNRPAQSPSEQAAALELIYEEFCQRVDRGENGLAVESELLARFPLWSEPLRMLIDCHRLLDNGAAEVVFPEPGETFGDFRLLAELGRGAQGRVYLATQPALADRPVVLKLSPRRGSEHLSLARLQHTHVVPLYSAQDDPASGLRALCLPYFGGATWERLLTTLADVPPAQRRGAGLAAALTRLNDASPLPVPVGGRAYGFLNDSSYVEAVSWVGRCLAEALQYAHERGLVHLDVKPSNVLLAADGEPMLLDFHLAREPIRPGAATWQWLGGTPRYMAPEQHAALDDIRAGRPVATAVDGRADVYSLGLTLYESLAGALPPREGTPAATLRRLNPQVSAALADCIARCLAAQAGERYPSADELASDLRRHLVHLPLQGVANRSLGERWSKWRRRRPHALALAGLVVIVVCSLALTLVGQRQRHREAVAALQEGLEQIEQQRYGLAISAFERGLSSTDELPWDRDLAARLRSERDLALRGQAAAKLHRLVERFRTLYGADGAPTTDIRRIADNTALLWDRRERIVDRLQPLADRRATQQLNDLVDLAILWSDLHVRLAAPEEVEQARREALAVLDDARAMAGPTRVLDEERRELAAAVGLGAGGAMGSAESTPPRTAWEHYALGRVFLRRGLLNEAAAEFEAALAVEPQGLWPNFYQGLCAYRLGRHDDAAQAFAACVVLSPQSGWCYYNRGLALSALGRSDRARRDFQRAVELDPSLAAAAGQNELLDSN